MQVPGFACDAGYSVGDGAEAWFLAARFQFFSFRVVHGHESRGNSAEGGLPPCASLPARDVGFERRVLGHSQDGLHVMCGAQRATPVEPAARLVVPRCGGSLTRAPTAGN